MKQFDPMLAQDNKSNENADNGKTKLLCGCGCGKEEIKWVGYSEECYKRLFMNPDAR